MVVWMLLKASLNFLTENALTQLLSVLIGGAAVLKTWGTSHFELDLALGEVKIAMKLLNSHAPYSLEGFNASIGGL